MKTRGAELAGRSTEETGGRWGDRDSLSGKARDAPRSQFQEPKRQAVRTAGPHRLAPDLLHPRPPRGDVKASVRKCPHRGVGWQGLWGGKGPWREVQHCPRPAGLSVTGVGTEAQGGAVCRRE